MSKLIFYFFAIIFFVILFNLVSGRPTQITSTKNPVVATEDISDDEEVEEREEEEEDDILYDDPIDTKKLALPRFKSNGIRVVSMRMDSLLFIGFLFSICSH
jgi:hypothetical protein